MEANDSGLVKFTSLAHALFHTYELSIPLFVGLWMAEFGVSAAVIGVVVTIGYGLIGVGSLPSGVLSDRFRSRWLITASVVGMGAGFALLGLARGLVSLTVALVLWGLFASLYHPAGLSLISRTAQARGTVFAYHGAGGNIGTAVGPLVTASLLLFVPWRLVAVALALPAALAAFIGVRIEFESEPTAAGWTDGGREPAADSDPGDGPGTTRAPDRDSLVGALRRTVTDLRGLFRLGFTIAFVTVLLYGIYYRGLLTFLPDILADTPHLVPVELLGREVEPAQYVYTALLTVGIGGQYAGGRLTDHLPSTTAFALALGGLGVLALAFPLASAAGIVPLLAVCLALGVFLYATAPIYQVVIAEYAPSDIHGLSYGVTYLAMFGVGAVGASLAGVALTHGTGRELFLGLAAIAAAGFGCVVLLRRL